MRRWSNLDVGRAGPADFVLRGGPDACVGVVRGAVAAGGDCSRCASTSAGRRRPSSIATARPRAATADLHRDFGDEPIMIRVRGKLTGMLLTHDVADDAGPRRVPGRQHAARARAPATGLPRVRGEAADAGRLRAGHVRQRGGRPGPRPDRLRPRRASRRRPPGRARRAPGRAPRSGLHGVRAGPAGGLARGLWSTRSTRNGRSSWRALRADQLPGAEQPRLRPAARVRAEPRRGDAQAALLLPVPELRTPR